MLAGILVLFPFIGLPEFWEYLYVVLPSAGIALLGLELLKMHSSDNQEEEVDNKDKDTRYIDDHNDTKPETESFHEDY